MTGSGKQYEHENNYIVNDPIAKITTGWWAYEHGMCKARDLRIEAIYSSLIHTNI
jgi:hypothetical protein